MASIIKTLKFAGILCVCLSLAACGLFTGNTYRDRAGARLAEVEAAANRSLEPAAVTDPPHVLITNATVWTARGDTWAPGFIVIRDGRIVDAGPGQPSETDGAHVIDARGAYVTPGIVDTHSHLGVYPSPGARAHSDGNEATAPTTPGVWAEHSLWPQDPGWHRAVAGGVTTAQVLPGSANLIGGRGVVVRPLPARGSRGMRFPGAPVTVKMACGENPKRVYGSHKGRAPSTRMGNVRGHRDAFAKAEAYIRELETKGARAPRNVDLETLALVLRGEAMLQVHCYRADDMLAFLQVADEFGFKVRSFHHALEAYKIRDILKAHGVSVSTWADWWGFKVEAYDGIGENAGLVHQAGGRAIIHSDSSRGIQRLNQEAAKALRLAREAGLKVSDDEAFQWITINAAWALGVDDEVGSIERGKRADIVVWSGHPFSVYGAPRWVFIDGSLRYDRDNPGPNWSDFVTGQEMTP